ncbi:MAG: DUF3592 domain-containing protein [Victivallales bacterium]|jgi:hypothetical protein|nr:DUF3592 domain-containing protein [Victivallales bacterium]MBT7165988.1 DUF3592 domain-containing protein [Victivallales bacterium]MBT7298563.1 DUF3592 domain-containing protein [Victivallales bacterium]
MRMELNTRSTSRLGTVVMYVLPWPCLLIGVVTLFFGFRGVRAARASTAWPMSEGAITSSEVKKSTNRRTSGGRTYRTSTTYRADVKYSYSIDGKSHVGDRVAFGDYGSSTPSRARGIVAKYPLGTKVDVFYDPSSPNESVLEPGMKIQALFLPAFGVAFALAGVGVLIFLPRAARKADRKRQEALEAD